MADQSASQLRCQVCEKVAAGAGIKKLLRCSKCHSAYYCSIVCQKADWKLHKKYVCSLWTGPGETVSNPWWAPQSPTEPAIITPAKNVELEKAAIAGDIKALKKYVTTDALLSVTKARHGETPLHLAVTSGKVEAVKILLAAGAYVNAVDWRCNNPLYYACTHPGNKNVLENDEFIRLSMVMYLVEVGADTMQFGGFSAERPFTMARRHGHERSADYIENSPLHAAFKQIREKVNKKHPPSAIVGTVRKCVDLNWRSRTANWLIQINRDGMGQCFKPHPQLLAKLEGHKTNAEQLALVEKMFKDCQARHVAWWASIREMAKE